MRWYVRTVTEKTLSGPRESTIRRLFALSMNRCAFPSCSSPIVTYETNTIVGEVCHIRAQNVGGPRYASEQTDEERHGFANLILLCRAHHKEIDTPENVARFSIEWLSDIKTTHEERAESISGNEPSAAILEALRLSATSYDSGAVHMDFRNATFRVGGEGGAFGGGGGSGGVLTIVGLAGLPPGLSVNLDGNAGVAPGGGGGGGGVLVFEGRPASLRDCELGFRISSFFAANATSLGSLLSVLEGGWSYCPIPSVPYHVSLKLAFIVECGRVEPNSLIRIDTAVRCPDNTQRVLASADVAVSSLDELVRRVPKTVGVGFDVREFGVHNLVLQSAGEILAEYPIEFRAGPIIPT